MDHLELRVVKVDGKEFVVLNDIANSKQASDAYLFNRLAARSGPQSLRESLQPIDSSNWMHRHIAAGPKQLVQLLPLQDYNSLFMRHHPDIAHRFRLAKTPLDLDALRRETAESSATASPGGGLPAAAATPSMAQEVPEAKRPAAAAYREPPAPAASPSPAVHVKRTASGRPKDGWAPAPVVPKKEEAAASVAADGEWRRRVGQPLPMVDGEPPAVALLLVLDLDETVVHAARSADACPPMIENFKVPWSQFPVFIRPGALEFLAHMATRGHVVAVSSAGAPDYVAAVVAELDRRLRKLTTSAGPVIVATSCVYSGAGQPPKAKTFGSLGNVDVRLCLAIDNKADAWDVHDRSQVLPVADWWPTPFGGTAVDDGCMFELMRDAILKTAAAVRNGMATADAVPRVVWQWAKLAQQQVAQMRMVQRLTRAAPILIEPLSDDLDSLKLKHEVKPEGRDREPRVS